MSEECRSQDQNGKARLVTAADGVVRASDLKDEGPFMVIVAPLRGTPIPEASSESEGRFNVQLVHRLHQHADVVTQDLS
jgi:hypothetical protein